MRGFSSKYLRCSSFGPVSPRSSLLMNWQLDYFFFLFGQQSGPGSKPARQQREQRRKEFELEKSRKITLHNAFSCLSIDRDLCCGFLTAASNAQRCPNQHPRSPRFKKATPTKTTSHGDAGLFTSQ